MSKETYFKRLNRYGLNYQSRVQTQREKEFENYLLKTIYRVDIDYNGVLIPGSFEKTSQDETKVCYYLLTRKTELIPNGTILWINSGVEGLRPWMVWYMEDIQASGYNRYTMLKMTHYVWWLDSDEEKHDSLCYFYGQEDNMLKDELKSRSRSGTLYEENLKLSFLIMPRNQYIQKEYLMFVGEEPFFEQYRVTGYDIQSSLGVEYVSVDPTYIHNITKAPVQQDSSENADYYWLSGGNYDQESI